MSNWTQSKLESPSGATLQLYSALTGERPRAVVQINHGMGEHAGRYQRFADFLNAHGYGVYAHDHRGHGETSSLDSHPGHFAARNGWDKVIEDVAAVNSHIKEQNPDVPIVCFGHSMGSIIAFNYALRHPGTYQALCCWNAGFTTGALAAIGRMILKVERLFKGSDVPSRITRKLTFDAWNAAFKPNRTEFDWLSRDDEEVNKYVNDPHCGIPISIGLWLDVLSGIYFNADDGNLKALAKDLPVHLQGGAADPCSEHGKAVEVIALRLKKAGLTDVTLTILENTRHESLNEINRDKTMSDFADWLDGAMRR